MKPSKIAIAIAAILILAIELCCVDEKAKAQQTTTVTNAYSVTLSSTGSTLLMPSNRPVNCDIYLNWGNGGQANGTLLTTNIVVSTTAQRTGFTNSWFFSGGAGTSSNQTQLTNCIWITNAIGFGMGKIFNVAGVNYSNSANSGIYFDAVTNINLAMSIRDTPVTSLSFMTMARWDFSGLGSDDHDNWGVRWWTKATGATAGEEATGQVRDGTGVVGTAVKFRIEDASPTARTGDQIIKTNYAYWVCGQIICSSSSSVANSKYLITLYSNDVQRTLITNIYCLGSANGGTLTNTMQNIKQFYGIVGRLSENSSADPGGVKFSDLAIRISTNPAVAALPFDPYN